MYSIIIPTMWKCDLIPNKVRSFRDVLKELNEHPLVGEIILIDNTEIKNHIISLNKIIHIFEGKNTYVNPAWNKGVSLAKYDKLIILNDDIWFDWNVLDIMHEFVIEEVGVIGMDEQNYNIKESNGLAMISTQSRDGGFGCCMFMHKSNYKPITEEMLIWGGDDWLFVDNRSRGKQNYKLVGLAVGGELSMTADSDEAFNPIKQNDLIIKQKYNLW